MPEAEELALVERIRGGDAEAWADLLSRYQHRLYTICYRMVNDHDMALDLTQDAMVKVIQGLDTWDGRSKLSTWIIRVTMNACLSKLRSEKYRRHASMDLPVHGSDGSTFGDSLAQFKELSAAERVERDEERFRMADALRRLSPEHKAILVLRDGRGLEYEQIAEILDIAVGTVKSRLFRARNALRELLE